MACLDDLGIAADYWGCGEVGDRPAPLVRRYCVAQREASGQPIPPVLRAAFLASDPQALAAHFEAACAYPDLAAALPTLRTPAFLYAGDADPGFAGVRRAAAEIPGATFVALPGLDHVQVFYAGATVLPQVRAFLNREV